MSRFGTVNVTEKSMCMNCSGYVGEYRELGGNQRHRNEI